MQGALSGLAAAPGRPGTAAWRSSLLPPLPPRPKARGASTVVRASSEQPQTGSSGGSGGSSGSGSDEPPPRDLNLLLKSVSWAAVVQKTMQEYDKNCQEQKEQLDAGTKQLADLDKYLQEMKEDPSMPQVAFSLMGWARNLQSKSVEEARTRSEQLASRRVAFEAALQQLAADVRANPQSLQPNDVTPSWMALAGYNWAVAVPVGEEPSAEKLQTMLREALERTSGPGALLWTTACTSLFGAWVAAWAGTFWGVDAYRLMHEVPGQAAAPEWLAWTVPYVAGTLGAYLLKPTSVTKCALRPVVDSAGVFQGVPAWTLTAVALIVGYCQVLTWQGLWQEAAVGWLGGSRDPLALLDPAALDLSVQQSMGSLVGVTQLPAFLIAPAAAVLTGVLEASFFAGGHAVRSSVSGVEIGTVLDEQLGNESEYQPAIDMDFAKSPFTEDELPLATARVALAGAYLCLEGTLTGSLWFAVGTSAAGMLTAMLLARGYSGSGGGGMGSS